jgi:hypothetical protein
MMPQWILSVDQNQSVSSTIAIQWPHQADLLSWCQQMTPAVAAALVMAGIIYLMFGYRIFRAVVLLNAAVLGGCLGARIPMEHQETSMAVALICAIFAAAIAWPTMKYAVALMGGLFGAALGASIWHTVDLDPHLVWAGAMVGLVGFGLFSFILFRGSVMMYTSLQGSFMLVFGILGLIYKYQQLGPKVTMHLSEQSFLLPAAVFIPAVVGLIFQQHHCAHGSSASGSGSSAKK